MTIQPGYDREAVELLFDTVKDSADRAMAQIRSLEARGAQGFSAATVLLGLASFSGFGVGHPTRAAFAFFVIAVLAYLAAACFVLKLVWPAEVSGLPSSKAMWEQLRQTEAIEVKASLTASIATAEADNDSAISERRGWARLVVLAVAVEGVAIGAAVLLAHLPS